MKRQLALLICALALGACATPLAEQPTPSPPPSATAPTAAAAPTAEAQPSATAPAALNDPAQAIPLDDSARLAAAEPAPRDQTLLAESFKSIGDVPEVARTTPLEVKVGQSETFWVSDHINNTNYQVTAVLRYAGPIVLIYVDPALGVEQADIERSARAFEQRIYPRNRQLFGQERSPGVDGDPRLTVLTTNVRGAGGYFSSADGVVKAVNRFSNEREMFVVGIAPGSDAYDSTLAHEHQHMIHWNEQRRSPSWFNEGVSTLAEDLNGYISNGTAQLYLQQPDLQLTTWSSDAAQSPAHYGLSQLFLRYFQEQYVGEQGMAELIKADAGNDTEAFARIAARTRPDITSFAQVYADWAVANILNDPAVADGRYAYKLLPGAAALTDVGAGEQRAEVSQFGADYLGMLEGPLTVSFDGAETVGLTGAQPHSGAHMWWSNRGDDSISTLTRAFDLSGVERATLEFAAWYELEKDFDYGFVAVSTDAGQTWKTLKGASTTDDDPQGLNFGNGLNGVSGTPGVEPDKGTRGQWIAERMDLSPFAGQPILLRFWVINDDAYNAQGLLIDDIRIPEIGYRDDGEGGEGGWQAQGFVRTSGRLAQQWALRLIRSAGGALSVSEVPVDQQGRAEVRVADRERAVLAVIGTTPLTTEPASYSYAVAKP